PGTARKHGPRGLPPRVCEQSGRLETSDVQLGRADRTRRLEMTARRLPPRRRRPPPARERPARDALECVCTARSLLLFEREISLPRVRADRRLQGGLQTANRA